jgi:hypothetical protein
MEVNYSTNESGRDRFPLALEGSVHFDAKIIASEIEVCYDEFRWWGV